MTRARDGIVAEGGFGLVEMLVSSAIMLTVTAAVFSLLDPAKGRFAATVDVADVQQRLRVAAQTLVDDLLAAGAGTDAGVAAGALDHSLAPILPYVVGVDPAAGTFYRPDAISLLSVTDAAAQTTLAEDVPRNATGLVINTQANCPVDRSNQLCGFERGSRVLVFDRDGAWDTFTVAGVQVSARALQYARPLAGRFRRGAAIAAVVSHGYYLKAGDGGTTSQLMRVDGDQGDLPVVDDVVKLTFEYFAEPQPPRVLPGTRLTDPVGPYTTYGPAPPLAQVDDPEDSWGLGENCVFTLSDGQPAPRLSVLAAGEGLVPLTIGQMTDGPWCPDEQYPRRFDADLLRIRRVRVHLRVQVTPVSLRGPAGVLFTHGGTARTSQRYVPDQEITFDVTPRNMHRGY